MAKTSITQTKPRPLNPRIILHANRPTSPTPIPRCTSILQNTQTTSIHQTRNLLLPLHELHREPLTRMPRDMAVHEPAPRIIHPKRNHKIPARGQRHRVPARWVGEIQLHGRGRVGAVALGEHERVMSVEVDGMVRGGAGVVADDPVDPGVGCGQREDVVVDGEDGLVVGDAQVRGVGPVEV